MKDDVKEKVSVVTQKVGMESAGSAINETIDDGAEMIQSAGETLTDAAHEKVKNVGTLNRERNGAHALIDAVPKDRIKNETGRRLVGLAQKNIKNVVDIKPTDLPAAVARTGVDGVALTVKKVIGIREPFANPNELKIGETKRSIPNSKSTWV